VRATNDEDEKLQGGKAGTVASDESCHLATLQPCNPVIFTSGNMPAGTYNHENRTLIPQMHADQH
jgi:hypothetical protein